MPGEARDAAARLRPEPAADAKLVARIRAGDDEAFVEAARRHQHRMLRLVGRFIDDHEEAEDVVQEAIVAAYRQRQRFRGDSSFVTWICRIAINQAVRASRRRRRDQSPSIDPRALGASPDQAELLAVREAVAALPDKLRTPVVLRFWEGLSGQEIADLLGWKHTTVWTRLYRALERLRHDLEGED